MNHVKVITALPQTNEAIRQLKELVNELIALILRTKDRELQEQLDRRILQLRLYIAELESDVDVGRDRFDTVRFNQAVKEQFVLKRKVKNAIHEQRELEQMRIPAGILFLIFLLLVLSAAVAGFVI
ncbi:hypothetical protein RISINGSUN_142 [Erwinia phage vB_EamM_RisingSun]|uniref:Uncharacterized protein n=2 Tax=Risingsunvirus risingsun TaxID=2560435 RepID=A0A223LII0_9CAUD|nr:hypothetical protein FDI45_gp142 [Erwinia phage vB_EamM_RisingSun]ASU03528.1 hypothetical protein RISINGSUN_142 [Erwinia phage vB_EamM_RisingSun]ASU03772.1 hypothetical protein JOAD_143 [Erwinia phage vB_EamM_Joad]